MIPKLIPLFLLCMSAMAQVQQRIVTPPAAMVVEGVPVIHTSLKLEQKVKLYTSSNNDASLLDWSQPGHGMLVRMDSAKGDATQAYSLETPMGHPKRLTSFKAGPKAALWQPGRNGSAVIVKDDEGNELQQVYCLDPKTNATALISDGKSQNAYPSGPIWSPGGDRIAFNAVHQTGDTIGICTVNPNNPATLKEIAQFPAKGWVTVNDWSPDGKHIVVTNGDLFAGNHIYLVDVATGKTDDVTPSQRVASYRPIGFTPDSKEILLATDLDSEFLRLACLNLESKVLSFLTPDSWDVDAFVPGDYEWPALSHNRKQLVFAMNEAGLSTIHLMDVDTKKVRNIPCPAPGLVRNLHWNGDGTEFAFNLVSNQTLGDIYSINTKTHESKRWTRLGPHGLDLSKNATPELIKWKSFDQREISGWLYRPPMTFKGKRPVIILIHGGPTEESRPDQLAHENYYINELGIAMILPNVRGSTGFGKTFADLDNGYKREDACKDIETLLDKIQQDPSLDASRIMIMGGSYGGYMTFDLATKLGNRVACYASASGMGNLVSLFDQTTPALYTYFAKEFGDPRDPKVKAFLEAISPVTNIQKIQRPILVEAGANDPRVPIKQTDEMVAAIKAHGTPVWYLRAGNEGHGMQLKDNSDFCLHATIAFVKTYLLNHP